MRRFIIFYLSTIYIVFSNFTDLFSQWEQVSGSFGGYVASVTISGTDLFVGTVAGVFLSSDNGNSWIPINKGLPPNAEVASLAVKSGDGDILFARIKDHGIFLSNNHGESWIPANNGLTDRIITQLATNSSYIFAGTDQNVFRSGDNGSNWEEVGVGIIDASIVSMAANDTLLFAATSHAVFRSTDNGENWEHADGGLQISGRPVIFAILYSIVIGDSYIYGGSNQSVFRSADNGTNWSHTSTFPIANQSKVTSLVTIGTDVFACAGVDIFHTSDHGDSWTGASQGLPKDPFLNPLLFDLSSQSNELYAATFAGVFHSTDSGLHWTAINYGLNVSPVKTLSVSGTNIFYDGGNGYFLKRSTDNGSTWTTLNDTAHYHFTNLSCYDSYVVVTTNGPVIINNQSPILRSTDLGENLNSLGRNSSHALTMNDVYTFTGSRYGSGVTKRCAHDSTTWTVIENGLPEYPSINTMSASGSNIYAGTVQNGIYYSSSNGNEWTDLNNELDPFRAYSAIAVNESSIFAATSRSEDYGFLEPAGIFRSLDHGSSWTKVNNGLTDTSITALVIYDSTLLAVSENSGVFVSNNNGTSWHPFNTGLPDSLVYCIGLNKDYLYAGLFGGIWRRPLSETVTRINSAKKVKPGYFFLEQNYPNPINPKTTIKYSLSHSTRVQLKIYSVTGEEVITLIDQLQVSGMHEIIWNAENYSSGIYFYQLAVGNDLSQTKKLILLK